MTSEQQVFKLFSESLYLCDIIDEIFTQKGVKGFDDTGDSFYIIKSNEYKSWLSDIAHLDAAAFEDEIIKTDLENMKGNFK